MKRAMLPGARLLRAVGRGSIKAVVDPTPFEGLEAVVDAVEHHNSGKNVGKVLVHLADPV